MNNLYSKENNIKIIKAGLFFIFFALIFSVSAAFAGTPPTNPAINGTVNDLTNLNANSDYGQQIINWIAYGKPNNVSFGEASLLSTISFTLNAIALVMMAYLSILGGATYVIQTANKGAPGGQVISSFWMPIRIATATILLIPLASGYSTIQYGVITVAEKGNAHGSYLMDQGIDYIAKNGVYRPPLMESSKEIVLGLILSELCRIHINTKEDIGTIVLSKGTENIANNNAVIVYSYNKNPSASGWKFWKALTSSPKVGYCGMVSISSPNVSAKDFTEEQMAETAAKLFTYNDYSTQATRIALSELTVYIEKQVIPEAHRIAQSIANDSSALNNLQNGGGKAAQSTYERMQKQAENAVHNDSIQFMKLASEYDRKTQQIIQSAIMQVNTNIAGQTKWVDQIKSVGWPALGAVFWQISKNQEALNLIAKNLKASYTQPLIDEEYQDDERYWTLYTRLNDLVSQSKAQKLDSGSHVFDMGTVAFAGTEGTTGVIKGTINGWFQGLMMAAFIPEDDGDLITKLQYSGSVLASMTDLIIHASMLLKAVSVSGTNILDWAHRVATAAASSVPLVGSITGAAGGAAATAIAGPPSFIAALATEYGTFASTLILPLLIAGFALAVVLPAIPLFFWLMGVLSWMLFFVECLLVSPMWLAAHGTAEKEGWGTEHTRQGYMLMIGLYLNPILRVAGFFAIFLVLIPLGRMVGWLSDYITGVISTGFLSPAIIVGSVVLLAVFAYSAAVRVFSLPNELFERGLRWVNGGQEVTGDSGAEQQNRMIIAQVGGKADGAAGAARQLSAQKQMNRPNPTT